MASTPEERARSDKWHLICVACRNAFYEGWNPTYFLPDKGTCCWCGKEFEGYIYYRMSVKTPPCNRERGKHEKERA